MCAGPQAFFFHLSTCTCVYTSIYVCVFVYTFEKKSVYSYMSI